MGFKLSCASDLETLKNMETIFKEESHVHQFIVPFETTVWNEADLPPRRNHRNDPANNAEQRNQQNSDSGSQQNTPQNNEQHHPDQAQRSA